MAVEIERKFLVIGDAWRGDVSESQQMAQGYLAGPPASRCSVRIRVAGENAHLNIKSATLGVERDEFEYPIPLADAEHMLAALGGHRVEKMRHHVRAGPHIFEIDEFLGDNAGLVVAEIELADPDEAFERPKWLGREVSDLARYYNLNLATHPYSQWSAAERMPDDALSGPE
ncbi:MAG TPA: CYTH domain-containing protein [Rhodanobacteraceae bacterium]|jgi:adenylate cyclase|nr:CYTH domain-containing protein [Rhodanobacteraceae bacterium]